MMITGKDALARVEAMRRSKAPAPMAANDDAPVALTPADVAARIAAAKPQPTTPETVNAWGVNYTPERVSPNQLFDGDTRMYYTPAAPKEPTILVGKRLVAYIPEIIKKANSPVVHTPFPALDKRLGGGLELHSMTLIVAGVGKGKSSLATQLAAHHAQTTGPCVCYVGEMGLYRYAARIIGQRTGRSWRDVLRAGVTEAEMHAAIGTLPIYGVERQANPIRAIAQTIAQARVDGATGVPMIVVDYVQLLADVAKDQRLSLMGAVRDLRAFVESAECVAVVLSQTSRGNAAMIREGTEHAEELVGTGGETAELEASASNVLVLSYTGEDGAEVHDVTLAIAKARDGGTSKLGMKYNGRTGVWTETGTIKLSKGEARRREAILSQIDIHEGRRCAGGKHPCAQGSELIATAFMEGTHKVVGGRNAVTDTLKWMVADGTLMRLGNVYRRPTSAPSTSAPSSV